MQIEKIKQEFLSAGFDLVGVSSPHISQTGKRAIEKWVQKDLHGTMRWFKNHLEKRTNPRALESWVKSIVVVGKNYFPGRAKQHKNGKISNYAWGKGYHKTLKKRIKKAVETINTFHPQIRTKAFVDSAPVAERDLAVSAALGWIGKSTMLITKEFGSWVFLGAVFTNLDLKIQTKQMSNFCGNCTACIDSCPTNALKPYHLDARKCISYQTIEKTGKMDVDLSGWSFGCDICQEVCPWNRFEKMTDEPLFAPKRQKTLKNQYNETEFFKEFAGTSIYRTGHKKINESIKINAKKP